MIPKTISPTELRNRIRRQEFTGPTSGFCPGFQQANLVILHEEVADDFEKFCTLNHQACPIIARLQPGEREPKTLAVGSDVATDLPKYNVWQDGEFVKECTDISEYWNSSLVSFFIGCSFGFEEELLRAGIPIRNIEQGKNVSMYRTSLQCVSVGPFHSPLVVSYRPVPKHLVEKTIEVSCDVDVL
eukprot:TRINITY_DN8708_c0_g2_i5.p1 TRINITY_DN8708_c0_g2~~TRINITY_DN8708_c0_g2_i5.p1  ORF type:complete len:186 (-),score=35.16 TRINITY_DN8708_c0_g2_i5:41-598(-)